MMSLLCFDHVTKMYGSVIGLNDVSCSLSPGITGLIGANGAGKSTLIKLASGQLRPSLGSVTVGGHSAWSTVAKGSLGYSPDIDNFYEEMTGRQFVVAMARLNGYSKREAEDRTSEALRKVGMLDRSARRLAGCSHGMRQRIKLAQALVHDPQLLLLDEPLVGIDPGGRREMNELLRTLADQGKTILVSSHILVEVEQIADTIVMLARGRVVASGTIPAVRGLLEQRPITVEILADGARQLASGLIRLPGVSEVEVRGDRILARTGNASEFFTGLASLAFEDGIDVQRFQTLDRGAEAVFESLR
jgi:ABC-2 type transport system ATP-binding protein